MTLPKPSFHFLSGLPRSGSTVLSAILKQNPKITAGMTSPVYSLVSAVLPQLSNANEFNALIDHGARTRMLRGLFETYYDKSAGDVVIDTNRYWTSRLPLLTHLFPQARFIICVRPLPEIVQSFETLFGANPTEVSRLIHYDAATNVYGRVEHLMGPLGIVGFPLNALKEAFFGPFSERLLLVSYQRLCAQPADVLAGIYRFLGLELFSHDLTALELDAEAYDRGVGLPGLHHIRPRLGLAPSPLSLPPDIVARLAGPYFWESPQSGSRADTSLSRGR